MRILGIDPGVHGGAAIVEIADGAAPQLVDTIAGNRVSMAFERNLRTIIRKHLRAGAP